MPSVVQTNFRVRKNLGRVRRIIDVPNLIDIQKSSYDKFLQMNVAAERAGRGWAPGGLSIGLPHQGLQRDERARLRLRTTSSRPSTTSTSAASAA